MEMKRITAYFLAILLITNISFTQNKQITQKPQAVSNETTIAIGKISSDNAIIKYQNGDRLRCIVISEKGKNGKSIIYKEKMPLLSRDSIKLSNSKEIGGIGYVLGSFERKDGKLLISELKPETDYNLNIYAKKGDSLVYLKGYEFNTVAQIPTKQASQISIIDATENTMTIKWVNGTGKGRIVAVRKGADVNLPENGKTYNVSSAHGTSEAKLGESYVVYDGNDKNINLTITNLESGRYYLQVFEYNGDGKYRAYNTEKASNNPRSKATLLPTPKILEVTSLSENSSEIKWEKVNGAKTYILDVAIDAGFKNKVEPYSDLDIGDLATFEISDLKPGSKYYIRLKAVGEGTESKFSKIFEYEMTGK